MYCKLLVAHSLTRCTTKTKKLQDFFLLKHWQKTITKVWIFWEVIYYEWLMQQQTHPKVMTGNGQLTRDAFIIINDFLRNPHFWSILGLSTHSRAWKHKKVLLAMTNWHDLHIKRIKYWKKLMGILSLSPSFTLPSSFTLKYWKKLRLQFSMIKQSLT